MSFRASDMSIITCLSHLVSLMRFRFEKKIQKPCCARASKKQCRLAFFGPECTFAPLPMWVFALFARLDGNMSRCLLLGACAACTVKSCVARFCSDGISPSTLRSVECHGKIWWMANVCMSCEAPMDMFN